MSTESRLWQPLKLGNTTLSHRIALAPLTRLRNDDDHLPLDLMIKYYADRASTPGTLVISEATGISKAAEAAPNAPGISSPEQIEGWRKIYDAVHAKGSFMFQQLWDLGRAGDPDYLKKRGYKYSSSSSLQMEGKNVAPEALTEEEIWQKIGEFRQAARNVVDAGGDGVEIHGAHG
jgi:NADPH2 dehydrogenase